MKTVKVRFAVEVNPEGEWSGGGDHEAGDEWSDHNPNYYLNNAKRYWVTAELPVPEAPAEPETVAGTVTEAA